jgi:hypothetical protein
VNRALASSEPMLVPSDVTEVVIFVSCRPAPVRTAVGGMTNSYQRGG